MNGFQYLLVGLLVVIVLALCEWNNTKAIVYDVMLRAKDLAKDKILSCGQEQEDWVVEKLNCLLPRRLTLFIGEDLIRSLVRFLYNKSIDYLDDGKFNNSVK